MGVLLQWHYDQVNNFVYFSCLIFTVPKRCSQGYRFSVCLSKQRATGIYLGGPSYKDKPHNSGVWLRRMNLDTPGHLQLCVLTQSHVTSRRPITFVSINSQCCTETPAHVCWLQGLLDVSVKTLTFFFFFFTNLGTGFLKVYSLTLSPVNTDSTSPCMDVLS